MDGGRTNRSLERPYQIRPLPSDFAEVFIREGWRGVEAAYGARTAVNKRWLREAGGEDLKRRRMEYRRSRRTPPQRAEVEIAAPPSPELIAAIAFLRSPRGGAWPISSAGGGDFYFGTTRLTGAEIVAKARRKGFTG